MYKPLGSLLLTAGCIFAHHGTSVNYQMEKTITLRGVVTKFEFVYPHPQLYFDVKSGGGESQHWTSEFGPTPLIMKSVYAGWSKESIKPGDQVTITCHPSKRSATNVCLCKALIINSKSLPVNP